MIYLELFSVEPSKEEVKVADTKQKELIIKSETNTENFVGTSIDTNIKKEEDEPSKEKVISSPVSPTTTKKNTIVRPLLTFSLIKHIEYIICILFLYLFRF